MIINEFYPGQGLGNQLWTHAASRSISENLGLPFAQTGLDHYKGHGFLSLTGGLDYPEFSKALPKRTVTFHEQIFYDETIEHYSSGYDSRVESLNGITKLQGIYQSEDYFYNDIGKLSSYFCLDDDILRRSRIGPEVCVLNIRGGEYKRHSRLILPKKYWIDAKSHMQNLAPNLDFVVVTDDKRYANALFPDLRVISGDIAQCYAAIYSARYVIVSNSSFSYFPIKTSPLQKIVIAPKNWARHSDKSDRWASPANIYTGWLWLDTDGIMYSDSECRKTCKDLELYYDLNYNVKIKSNLLEKRRFQTMIPVSMRKKLKKLLSYFFPKRIG